jgi:hypothetical protein
VIGEGGIENDQKMRDIIIEWPHACGGGSDGLYFVVKLCQHKWPTAHALQFHERKFFATLKYNYNYLFDNRHTRKAEL